MASLLSGATGGGPSSTSATSSNLPDIPIDHLDYAYIEKCSNANELKDILEVLRSGKEGRWFDLEKACEEKMVSVMPPKERKLYLAQITEPTHEERESAANDIASFLSNITSKDQSLRKRRQDKLKSESDEVEAGMPTSTVISHKIFVEGEGDDCNGHGESKRAGTSQASSDFPPVRNSGDSAGESTTNATSHTVTSPNETEAAGPTRALGEGKDSSKIPAYDWEAWERFDVDEALKEMDKEELEQKRMVEELEAAQRRKERERKESLQSELEKLGLKVRNVKTKSDEELEFLANCEKRKGNECFKAGEFEESFMFFSRAVLLNPKEPTLFANRALSALKLKRYQRAEEDCTCALELDPTYSKAIARRGMARHYRGKYLDAIDDFEVALEATPQSKELNRLLGESRKKYNEVGGIGADRPGAPPRIFKKKQEINKADGMECGTVVQIEEEDDEDQGFTKLTIVEDDDDDDDEEEDEEEEEEEHEEGVEEQSAQLVSPADISAPAGADEATSPDTISPPVGSDETASPDTLSSPTGSDETASPDPQVDSTCSETVEHKEEQQDSREEQQVQVNETTSVDEGQTELTWEQTKAEGVTFFQQGQYEHALESFRKAAEVLDAVDSNLISEQERDLGLCACLGNQAACHQLQGQHEETIAVCTRVLEINASHSKSLFRRGNSYSAIGNNDAALDDMCQIIRFDPDNVEASDAIAKLMTQSHTQEQSTAQVNVTNKKTEKFSSAPTKQATQEKAKPKKAEQPSQKKNAGIVPVPETAPIVSPIKPPSPPAPPAAVPVKATQSPVDVSKKVAEFKTIGNAHFKAGKLEDAITAYSDALSLGELNGASISILSNRAMAHLKVNKPAACVEDCTTALDLLLAAKQDDVQVPVMVKLLYRRASANKTLNALPAAIADLEQAHALEPHNKAVRVLLQQLRDAQPTSTDPNVSTDSQGQAKGTATSNKRAPLVQEVVPDVERQQQIALERQKAKMRAEAQSENAQKAKDIAARARVRQRDDAALPGVPKSVHEFQSSWRLFNGNQQRRGEYLFQIPLPHLCKLLRVEVNDDLLVEIANALVALGSDGEALAARQADWALGLLRALSKLSRFSTAVMFLSGSATKLFAQVFEVIYDKLGTNQEMKDTVHEVRSKYCKQ